MIRARLEWQVAKVIDIRSETPRARTIVLDVPAWPGHHAGQHVDVRLVAEDGYRAERSYSIASPPASESASESAPESASESVRIELTVERLDDGEVSPYLCDVLRPGDGLEVRGPIGGYFVWTTMQAGPLFLVAGGSGIVPLMAMLRHRAGADATTRATVPVRLLYSARSWADIIYREELEKVSADPTASITFTLTREQALQAPHFHRRVDRAMLEETAWPAADMPNVFVCGPTSFTESVASLLVELGHAPAKVRTERFGPTG